VKTDGQRLSGEFRPQMSLDVHKRAKTPLITRKQKNRRFTGFLEVPGHPWTFHWWGGVSLIPILRH
jgi:hypothetical protein